MAAVSDNYSGTAIFLAYIIVALRLTYSIANRLWRRATTGTAPVRPNARVLMAIVSFTVLSYYMSAFLVTSYTGWARNDIWKLDLWHWMTGSSLFTDFAHELMSNEWATVWTTAALLWTGAVNVWLAVEGRRHKTKSLWQYFAIAQILPISFAQSLFAIDLSISRARESVDKKTTNSSQSKLAKAAPQQPAKSEASEEDETEYDDLHIDTTLAPVLLDGADAAVITFTSTATMYMIYLLPSYVDQPEFMYLVLATRLLLFAPSFVAMREEEPEDGGMDPMDAALYLALLIGPMAFLIYTTVGQVPSSEETFQAAIDGLHTGMATRALGYDLLIGLGSATLMLWGAV